MAALSEVSHVLRDVLELANINAPTGPPHASYQPTIYISGDSQEAVREVELLLGRNESILKIRILERQGVGAASALKLSYAGLTKGFTALGVTMVLGKRAFCQ